MNEAVRFATARWQALLVVLGLAAAGVGSGSLTAQASALDRLWPYGIARYTDVPPPRAPDSRALLRLQTVLNADLNAEGGQNSGLVIDETTDRTLWTYNDDVPRLPASVEKLWTTTTALLKFGPNARFHTSVLGVGQLNAQGTYVGTIYLRGGGDPTFGSGGFDHKLYDAGATVQSLAARVRALGIRAIDGRVVGDASYFDALQGGPDTGYNADLETEGALSALSFDAGFTNVEEEKLVPDPALSATVAFVSALRADGVTVPAATPVTLGVTPSSAVGLTSVSSPRLSRLLALTNAPSDNFFAETLLKDLGARFGGSGSTAAGASVVSRVIKHSFGLRPQITDGSGLSRDDLSTARQVVLLLREMQAEPAFWNSLAIAGVSGSMQSEMVGTSGAGNCRGKTGTLHDVANLVGYCTDAVGHRIVFAFLMNGLTDTTDGHQLEDLAGEALAAYRGGSTRRPPHV